MTALRLVVEFPLLRDVSLCNQQTAPSPQSPSDVLAADNGANRLAEAPFDHRTPGHQAEAEPVVEHREAAASEQDGAAVDARRSVTVGERAVGEAGFRGDRARCGCHVAVAELREQIR